MNTRPFDRTTRVGALIHEGVSGLLQTAINDPRLASATVTGVKMTSDLKLAKIYFVVSDMVSTKENALAGFEQAKGFIKYTLAQKLKLRYMPDLQFFYDDSIDYGFHIDSVLKNIANEHTTDHQPTEKE